MFAKHLTAGLVATAFLATAAYAQTPTATTDRNATTTLSTTATSQGQWRSSKVVGLNVYNDSNEKLGDINELLLDKNGKIDAVVLGVGGFLGVGEHYVSVPFEKIKWVNEPAAGASASNRTAPAGSNTATTTTTTTTTGAAPGTGMASSSTTKQWYPDHAMLSATKDQLKAMPEFKYSN